MLDKPNLLLDVGNTSIKYAWYHFPNAIADLNVLRTTLDSLPQLLEQAATCWLCSVVAEQVTNDIANLCKVANVEFHEMTTQAEQLLVTNAYKTPTNMGCDRWMAMLAGSALCDMGENSHYIVVDAGTAITCDFVVGNKHLGGWIAPGLSLARHSVVKHTTKVFDDTHTMHKLTLGNDTPQCVAQGALAQITGMLSQACKVMRQHCDKFEIYVSGGDAPLMITSFSELEKDSKVSNLNYLENLVLIGLAKVAHEKIAGND